MQQGFFEKLQSTNVNDVVIAMKVDDNGNITVVITPKTIAKDSVFKTLEPLFLTGPAAEVDLAFFDLVTTPLQKTQEMFSNAESYQATIEEAAKDTKAKQDEKAAEAKKKTAEANKAPNLDGSAKSKRAIKPKADEVTSAGVEGDMSNAGSQILNHAAKTQSEKAPPKSKEELEAEKKQGNVDKAVEELKAIVEDPEFDMKLNKFNPLKSINAVLALDDTNEFAKQHKKAFIDFKLGKPASDSLLDIVQAEEATTTENNNQNPE